MIQIKGERTLEKYNLFPYIAWATFIAFSLFVYGVTVELREATENLDDSTSRLEEIVKTKDLTTVEDFDI